MTRNYRNSDPPTSVLAGSSIEADGSARQQRTRCLEMVAAVPGLTAREIEARLGIKAHKRLPELREAGLIKNGPARLCTVSGRQALTWDFDGYRFVAGKHQHHSHVHPTPCIGAHA